MALKIRNDSSLGGSAPPALVPAVNVNSYQYFTAATPFLDWMKQPGTSWSAYAGADGWPENIPNGGSCWKYIMIHLDYGIHVIPSTSWVMTWSGPLEVRVHAVSLATNKVASANRYTFDLPALTEGNSGGQFILVEVINNTGSTQSINSIKLFQAEHEAAVNAGEIFQPAFLNDMAGASVVRFMVGLMDINDSPIVNYSDIPTEAGCDWSPAAPISIIGKLAAQIKKDIWINIPHQATQACMNSIFQELWNHIGSIPSIRVWVEYSNETWNSIFAQYAYCRDTKAPSLPGYPTCITDTNGNPSVGPAVQDKIACATAHGSMQAWTAAETYFPRSRVVRVFCGQAANFGQHAGGFEYQDTSDTLYPNQKLKDLVDAYGIAPYFSGITTLGKYGVPTDMTLKSMVARSEHLKPDAYWDRAMQNGIDLAESWVTASKSGATTKRANIKLISYELGGAYEIILGTTNTWTANKDLVNNAMDFGIDITSIFSDGEELIYLFSGTAMFTGATKGTAYKVRLFGTNGLRVYANQADYDSNTPATLIAGGDPFYIQNFTRCHALMTKWRTLMDTTDYGPRWLQEYYDRLAKAGLELFMQFVASGGYTNGGHSQSTNWFMWGLKRSQWDADSNYRRAQWFRRFANGT